MKSIRYQNQSFKGIPQRITLRTKLIRFITKTINFLTPPDKNKDLGTLTLYK